jgi:hypothetical protein
MNRRALRQHRRAVAARVHASRVGRVRQSRSQRPTVAALCSVRTARKGTEDLNEAKKHFDEARAKLQEVRPSCVLRVALAEAKPPAAGDKHVTRAGDQRQAAVRERGGHGQA